MPKSEANVVLESDLSSKFAKSAQCLLEGIPSIDCALYNFNRKGFLGNSHVEFPLPLISVESLIVLYVLFFYSKILQLYRKLIFEYTIPFSDIAMLILILRFIIFLVCVFVEGISTTFEFDSIT